MRKSILLLPVAAVVPAMLLSGCNVLFRPANNSTATNGSIFGNMSFDNMATPPRPGGGTTGNDLTADQGGSATPPGGGSVPGKPGADSAPQDQGGDQGGSDQGSTDQGSGDQGGDEGTPAGK